MDCIDNEPRRERVVLTAEGIVESSQVVVGDMASKSADNSDEHGWGVRYQDAMRRLREYITRADDGTFHLDILDGNTIGVDPVVFADLKRSIEQTNRKIRRGEISAKEISFI